MAGGWEFHGKKRASLIEPGYVVAGSPGDRFGCKHNVINTDSYIFSLQPDAFDEPDKAIFDDQVIPRLQPPRLSRIIALDDDDAFDSFVFEMFDLVSGASLGGVARTERTNVRVQRMKRFIEQHAFESITLSDVASCVALSPFACLRQFKNATGSTPLRYISRLRLERAQELLRSEAISIEDVARRVGIRDRCYFTRWFSKETGIPPYRFRQIASSGAPVLDSPPVGDPR
jgi:AraC-like DNA-binding protein